MDQSSNHNVTYTLLIALLSTLVICLLITEVFICICCNKNLALISNQICFKVCDKSTQTSSESLLVTLAPKSQPPGEDDVPNLIVLFQKPIDIVSPARVLSLCNGHPWYHILSFDLFNAVLTPMRERHYQLNSTWGTQNSSPNYDKIIIMLIICFAFDRRFILHFHIRGKYNFGYEYMWYVCDLQQVMLKLAKFFVLIVQINISGVFH